MYEVNDNEATIASGFRRHVLTNCAQNRLSSRGTVFTVSSRTGVVLTHKAEMASVPVLAAIWAPLFCAAELASEVQIISEDFHRKV
ncbi:formate dehydrogenase accessory sulfurtransferase FdhD [Cryobacterium sp. M15]|uniref:formate dehydrogenase accessory sulfurtransferase FdhD n=1 Tax=Cryobacterium sp. M15 TaxID=2048291 RepID=UPI0011B04889